MGLDGRRKSATGTTPYGSDAGSGLHLAEVTKYVGSMQLAVLPIGAYEPR
jgi:hypothetical protein